MEVRTACAICGNTSLSSLYTIKNMPVSLSVTEASPTTDIFANQNVVVCSICSCPQLEMLIDPNILYGTAHNLTHMLPTWNEHHNALSEFILSTCTHNSVMEIGGLSGALYNILKSKNNQLDYSCIDLCPATYDTTGITYIVDNCETYDFTNVPCLIMSHVFEHLYSPMTFIDNLAKTNEVAKTVYISIPNMTQLLENKSCSILHFEHTYFIDKYFAEYMFSRRGFRLTDCKEFGTHSIFMRFEQTNCSTIILRPREYIPNILLEINKNMIRRFTTHSMNKDSFIIPSGHMGQLVFTIAQPSHIIGFLDNDVSKHNKRLYGTPYHIYPFSKLNDYTNCTVYIYAGPYLAEILKQISAYKHVTTVIL